ncbi:thioesterase II family protein, partial [Streptomyces xanthochromogenes]
LQDAVEGGAGRRVLVQAVADQLLEGLGYAVEGNAQVRKVVLPTLRADYRLVERYRPRLDTRVSCTVAACLGDKDPEVTEPEARAWAEVTGGAFAFRLFDGDHFYLRGQEEALASWLLTTADRENP